ncbi:MAG: DUF222 domain-containing protein [Mycobacterium sp.]
MRRDGMRPSTGATCSSNCAWRSVAIGPGAARGRRVDVAKPENGSGTAAVEAVLFAEDADALDQRLEAMAGAVCHADPRTLDQRRSDALGALGHGADRLACSCEDPHCPAAGTQPSAVIVHVVANEDSLSDDTPVALDGEEQPGPTAEQLRQMTITEALTPPSAPTAGPAATPPAAIMGGGMVPAPLLAAALAHTAAKVVAIVHPGDAPPQPHYIPTTVLATFIRCRDMTCRFPGCDEPAHHCDIDHTIAYPAGPTQASNLKCLCRKQDRHIAVKKAIGPNRGVTLRPRGCYKPGKRTDCPSYCDDFRCAPGERIFTPRRQ